MLMTNITTNTLQFPISTALVDIANVSNVTYAKPGKFRLCAKKKNLISLNPLKVIIIERSRKTMNLK